MMYSTFFTTLLVFLLELRSALAAPVDQPDPQLSVEVEIAPSDAVPQVVAVWRSVGVAFKVGGQDEEEYVEVPFFQRVPTSDYYLSPHPSHARIVGVFETESGPQGTKRKELDSSQTLCMAYPQHVHELKDRSLWGNSRRHAARVPSGQALLDQSRAKAPSAPVWWKAADGWVDFTNAKGRRWLKGLQIEGLMCI